MRAVGQDRCLLNHKDPDTECVVRKTYMATNVEHAMVLENTGDHDVPMPA